MVVKNFGETAVGQVAKLPYDIQNLRAGSAFLFISFDQYAIFPPHKKILHRNAVAMRI
jgi:hypothetical protein